jgi:hypothetical protein
MYCGAGIFVISASVNIRNGAINLKWLLWNQRK